MNMRARGIPVQETKYLRSKVDGYVYVWTQALSEREDMMPCEKMPDDFKKDHVYAAEEQADIRFMKKAEVMDEARVVFGISLDRTLTAQRMKIELRKMRKGTYEDK